MLTKEDIHTLQHSLGLTNKAYEYRNHFATRLDDPQVTGLVKSGHMKRGDKIGRDNYYFYVTEKGRKAAWAHMPPYKAYEITVVGFEEGSSIVHALDAGKAKYEAFLDASEALEDLSIKQFRARRCPEMDRKAPEAFRRSV